LVLSALSRSRVRARSKIAPGSVRDLSAEKGLNASKLVVALLADRELDAIAVRRGVVDGWTA